MRIGELQRLSFVEYQADAQMDNVFTGLAAFTRTPLALGGDTPARVDGAVVSGNYFEVLGIAASVRRLLSLSDDVQPGGHSVAVISHALGEGSSRVASYPNVHSGDGCAST